MCITFEIKAVFTDVYFCISNTQQVSDVEIQRLFRRAVAPDTHLKVTHLEDVRGFLYGFIRRFLRYAMDSSQQREQFGWRKLVAEGSNTNIVIRALDILIAVDTSNFLGLCTAGGPPSILNLCHSLGQQALAMQLAAGVRIEELAAPHSAKQVGPGTGLRLVPLNTALALL